MMEETMTDWSACFALIIIEGTEASRVQVLCFQDLHDATAPGLWRLPGGLRLDTDTDPIATLARELRMQTGFRISEEGMLALLKDPGTEIRIQNGEEVDLYFVIYVSMDEYIDERPGFELKEGQNLGWLFPEKILGSHEFHAPHQEVVRRYMKDD